MRSARAVRIPCSACHGHGEVELAVPHFETFGRVDSRWRSTAAILNAHAAAPMGKPTRTALVNRLNALVRWGLVDRRGTGRSVEWRRI